MLYTPGQLVAMELIDVGERVRPVDEVWAQALAANFEEHGIKTAIVLRPQDGGRFSLVIGGHRHRAAEILEWEEIPAFVMDFSDEEALVAEIDENLMRHELTKLDRAVSLLKRKDVHERMHPETGHGKAPKGKSQSFATLSKRFTADVAERTDLSERAVQLAIQIAERLDKEAAASLRGTSMANNQNALLKLSQEPVAKQRTLAAQLRDGAKTLDAAKIAACFEDNVPANQLDPQGRYLATLMETWVKASPDTRARFLAEIKLAEGDAAKAELAKGKRR